MKIKFIYLHQYYPQFTFFDFLNSSVFRPKIYGLYLRVGYDNASMVVNLTIIFMNTLLIMQVFHFLSFTQINYSFLSFVTLNFKIWDFNWNLRNSTLILFFYFRGLFIFGTVIWRKYFEWVLLSNTVSWFQEGSLPPNSFLHLSTYVLDSFVLYITYSNTLS